MSSELKVIWLKTADDDCERLLKYDIVLKSMGYRHMTNSAPIGALLHWFYFHNNLGGFAIMWDDMMGFGVVAEELNEELIAIGKALEESVASK